MKTLVYNNLVDGLYMLTTFNVPLQAYGDRDLLYTVGVSDILNAIQKKIPGPLYIPSYAEKMFEPKENDVILSPNGNSFVIKSSEYPTTSDAKILMNKNCNWIIIQRNSKSFIMPLQEEKLGCQQSPIFCFEGYFIKERCGLRGQIMCIDKDYTNEEVL